MVSFSCEACGDVLTKKKLDPHRNRCQGATFTCIDCMVHFQGVQYRSHTSCITEDQKYQGALYKEKTKKPKNTNSNGGCNQNYNHRFENPAETQPAERRKNMSQQPYVEDVGEDGPYEACHAFVGQPGQDASPAGALPEAPMPPAASTEEQVNVFDFLVSSGQTPNASNMNLVMEQRDRDAGENTSLVRYECEPDKYLVAEGEQGFIQGDAGIQPPADGAFVTPVASKAERRRSKESELKKDKKRKRLDVDIPGDQVMTDAPPVLHSGLTGGLKGLMRPVYPPSPDYSGGDANDNSLTSPLKKTKHSKHAKNSQVSHSLFDMITGGVKKPSKKKSKKHSHRHSSKKDAKLIEFSPSQSKNNKADGTDGQMIVFKPRADAFLSFVNKGPESEKGCSMNKTLKRFHRERQSSGSNLAKAKAEKELWRTLRMRRNDRGEIVLFAVEDGQ